MHRFTIHSRWLPDLPCDIPSRWEELTGSQLEKIAWLSRLRHRGPNLAKLFFLVLTESLPRWKRFRARWFFIVTASLEDKANLLFLVNSFQTNQQFTDQKLPKIRLKAKKIWGVFVLLYGPSSKLGNATFWEFVQAEKYYLNYLEAAKGLKSKKDFDSAQSDTTVTLSTGAAGAANIEGWLNKLVATLYREARADFRPMIDTDIRVPLTDEGFKWRLHLVERMPMDTKLAILMWFESCRSLIIQSFPTIFQPPAPSQKKRIVSDRMSARERSGQHWLEMISELAGSMDRYDAIGNTGVWIAFTDITHKIKKNEKAQQQAEAAKARARRK